MRTFYYDETNGEIHSQLSDGGGVVRPISDDDGHICGFSVFFAPDGGGQEELDCHCNTLADAMFQLDMVSA